MNTRLLKQLLLLSVIICSCTTNNKNNSNQPVKVGDMIDLSDYSLITINQGKIAEEKLILIDFWATWCGPCIASFPHLEELQDKFGKELQIIAVSDESTDVVNNFLTKKSYNLSFFSDPKKQLFKRFNIQQLPTSSLISKQGEILWVGNSNNLEQILNEYLNSGKITQPAITEFNKSYYPQDADFKKKQLNSNYSLSEGKDPTLYFAKNQKDERDLLNIKYVSVPISEIIMDFYSVDHLNFVNNRMELDTILLNIEAKSNTLTYGEGKKLILEDIQETYNFRIESKSKNKDVYLLSILDQDLLEEHIEVIEGGGMIKRQDGQHLITRLSLNQLASYFQSRLKVYFKYEGENNSKFNLILDDFNTINDLHSELNSVGLSYIKQQRDIEMIEIN